MTHLNFRMKEKLNENLLFSDVKSLSFSKDFSEEEMVLKLVLKGFLRVKKSDCKIITIVN